MLGHLIRKEILDQILSLRFLILSSVGALVIWLSLYSGYDYYRDCQRDYHLAQTVIENRLREVGSGNIYEVSDRGYPVFKPPVPMSIFVRGLDHSLGRMGSTGAGDIPRLNYSPIAEEPILGFFPPLDLARVVQVVVSMFVLLLTYDTICGEKTAGTLRLIASAPVSRDRLLLGKLIGAQILMLAAFGLPLVLGIAVVLVMPDVQFRDGDLLRLGVILVTFGLYLAVFTCAGLCASCLTHRAATSFVILLVFWAASVAVLPRLSLIVADVFSPAPSFHQLQAKVTAIATMNSQERKADQSQWNREFTQRTGKHWWQVPEGIEGRTRHRLKMRHVFRTKGRSLIDRLEEDFWNRYNDRLDMAITLGRISPAFALSNAVIKLAGTGRTRHRRFQDVYTRTTGRVADWYWEKVTQRGLHRAFPNRYEEDGRDLSDIPKFVYRDVWTGQEVKAALFDIVLLAIWALMLFLISYVALLRYDLR